jgi:4-diphosphocytidyl-2-C-methyl-D-erythritol kinase
MPRPRTLTLKAPAKINLFLRVGEKRPDGYHEIYSLLQMIGLYDTLRFTARPRGIRLLTGGLSLPSGRDNLVYRAAERLRSVTGAGRGAEIRLLKRIPVAAGLGGGSSDAAACLVGLSRLWDLRMSLKELDEIASGLGSDVPFFLHGPTAVAEGRGERVRPARLSGGGWVVLVAPPIPVSTAEVYGGYTPRLTSRHPMTKINPSGRISIPGILSCLVNDLETVTPVRHPEIREIKEALIADGMEGSLMSGSGPAVFGLTRSERVCRRVARAAAERWPGWGVWAAPLLRRVPWRVSR